MVKVKIISKDESVIYNNLIYRFGDELDMDEGIAKSLMERGYVEIHADEDLYPQEEVIHVDNLEELKYQELKKMASEAGIDATGTKAELIERLKAELEQIEETIESDESEDPEEEDETDSNEAKEDAPNTSMPEDE